MVYYGARVSCQAESIAIGRFIPLSGFLTPNRWFPIVGFKKNINWTGLTGYFFGFPDEIQKFQSPSATEEVIAIKLNPV
jgi:hypothetical protein